MKHNLAEVGKLPDGRRVKAAIRRERVALLTSVMFDTCFSPDNFHSCGWMQCRGGLISPRSDPCLDRVERQLSDFVPQLASRTRLALASALAAVIRSLWDSVAITILSMMSLW